MSKKNTAELSNGFGYDGNSYIPVQGYAQLLPSGIYGVRKDFQGNLHFVKREFASDSLIFGSESFAPKIIEEFRRFILKRAMYEAFGFMHKRSFLLWGPPGNGKTSLVIEMARLMIKELDGIVIIGDTDPDNVGAAILHVHNVSPGRPIIVIMEEVDGIYRNWPTELLTLLDGGTAVDNTFFIATTNYLENLDPRVRNRPSRFDTLVEVGPPSAPVRLEYLLSKGVERSTAEAIAGFTEGLSFAHLKECIIGHVILEQELAAVVKRLREMGDVVSGNDDDDDYDPDDDD